LLYKLVTGLSQWPSCMSWTKPNPYGRVQPIFFLFFWKKKQLLWCFLTQPNQAELGPQTQQA
jgi:hypothetical protein